jgi:hypothetical protein
MNDEYSSFYVTMLMMIFSKKDYKKLAWDGEVTTYK